MSEKESVKAKSFVIVVDDDLEHILNVMIGKILDAHGIDFMKYLMSKGLSDRWRAFLRELSDKVHEHDMCLDPQCKHDLSSLK